MSWNSVSESLPELETPVLTYSESGTIRVGKRGHCVVEDVYYWENAGSDSCNCCDFYDANITHWMELPDKPREAVKG